MNTMQLPEGMSKQRFLLSKFSLQFLQRALEQRELFAGNCSVEWILENYEYIILSPISWWKASTQETRTSFLRASKEKSERYKSFVLKQSELLNLSEEICESLIGFLSNFFTKNNEKNALLFISLKEGLSSTNDFPEEKHLENLEKLSTLLTEHYISERKSSIVILLWILKEEHNNGTSLGNLIGRIRDDFFNRFRSSFDEVLADLNLCAGIPSNVFRSESCHDLWISYALKERFYTLSIIFEMIRTDSKLPPGVKTHIATKILEGISLPETSILHNSHMLDTYEGVNQLSALVFIKCLDIDYLLGNNMKDLKESPILSLDSIAKLGLLQETVEKKYTEILSKNPEMAFFFGPIFLSWGLVLRLLIPVMKIYHFNSAKSFIEMIQETNNKKNVEGNAVAEHKYYTSWIRNPQSLIQNSHTYYSSFLSIVNILKRKSHYHLDTFNENHRRILKDLLMLFLESVVDISSIPDLGYIVSWFSLVFEDSPNLSLEWWKNDYNIPARRKVLDIACTIYPSSPEPLMDTMTNLANNSESSSCVFVFLSSLSSLALNSYLFNISQDYVKKCDKEYTWEFSGPIIPGSNEILFTLPYKPKVQILSEKLVLILSRHSSWGYFLSFIDVFVNLYISTQSNTSSNRTKPDMIKFHMSTMVHILNVLKKIFENADGDLIAKIRLHFVSAVDTKIAATWKEDSLKVLYKKVCQVANIASSNDYGSSRDLFSSSLGLLISMIPHIGDQAWVMLFESGVIDLNNTISSHGHKKSISSIISCEEADGEYPLTSLFLDVLYSLIVDLQKIRYNELEIEEEILELKAHIAIQFIELIRNDYLAKYWLMRYKKIYDRLIIESKIISIFNKMIRDTTWFFSCLESEKKQNRDNSENGYHVKKVEHSHKFGRVCGYVQKRFIELFVVESSALEMGSILKIIVNAFEHLRIQDCFFNKAIKVAEEGLEFLRILIQRRRELGLPESDIEKCITDSSRIDIESKNQGILKILTQCIAREYSLKLSINAADTLVALLGDNKEQQKSLLPVYRYFETNAQELLKQIVNIAVKPLIPKTYKRSEMFFRIKKKIFNFLTLLVATNPFIKSVVISDEFEDNNKDNTREYTLIDWAVNIVLRSSNKQDVSPTLLLLSLNLLNKVWESGGVLSGILQSLRKNLDLYKSFRVILEQFHKDDTVLKEEEIFYYGEDTNYNSQICTKVENKCNRLLIVVLTLRIVIAELRIIQTHENYEIRDELCEALKVALNGTKTKEGCLYFSLKGEISYNPSFLLKYIKHNVKNYQFFLRIMKYFSLPGLQETFNDMTEVSDSYFYDLKIMNGKLICGVDDDQKNKMLRIMCYINRKKSIIDARWKLLNTFKILVNTIVLSDSNMEAKLKSFKYVGINEDWAYYLVVDLSNVVKEENCLEDLAIAYLADVCDLMKSLLFYWVNCVDPKSPNAQKSNEFSNNRAGNTKDVVERAIDILELLDSCLNTTSYNLGPSGVISEYPFQRHLFSSILSILVLLNSKNIEGNQRLLNAKEKIMVKTYHALMYILKGLSINAKMCNFNDAEIIFSCANELIPQTRTESVYFWMKTLKKYEIIEKLVQALSNILGYYTEKNTKLLNILLENILAASIIPQFSAEIQDTCIWSIFCRRSIFLTHEEVQLYPKKIQNESIAYEHNENYNWNMKTNAAHNDSEISKLQLNDQKDNRYGYIRDTLHKSWYIILSIASQLVKNCGSSSECLSSAISFVTLYEKQINNALHSTSVISKKMEELLNTYYNMKSIGISSLSGEFAEANPGASVPAENLRQTKNDSITEINRITTLFLSMANWAYLNKNFPLDGHSVLSSYKDIALNVLSCFTLLFENPNELYLRVSIDPVEFSTYTKDDMSMSAISWSSILEKFSKDKGICITDEKFPDKMPKTKEEKDEVSSKYAFQISVVSTMIKITQTILLHLILSTRASEVLSIDDFLRTQKSFPTNIFHPTISVHVNIKGATFGCLFDLLRRLTKFFFEISGSSANEQTPKINRTQQGDESEERIPNTASNKKAPILFYFACSLLPITHILNIAEMVLLLITTETFFYKNSFSVPNSNDMENFRELVGELWQAMKTFEESVKALEKSCTKSPMNLLVEKLPPNICISTYEFIDILREFQNKNISSI